MKIVKSHGTIDTLFLSQTIFKLIWQSKQVWYKLREFMKKRKLTLIRYTNYLLSKIVILLNENDIGNVDKIVKLKYSFLKYLFIILALSLCM